MNNENNQPVSGYGSRLQRHISTALSRFGKLPKENEERELTSYLLESISLGLSLEHLMEALGQTLKSADYDCKRIEGILRRIQELTKKGTYEVIIKWAAEKPTNEEIVKARMLCSELREKHIEECKKILGGSTNYCYRTCGSELLAAKGRQEIESSGLTAVVRRNYQK